MPTEREVYWVAYAYLLGHERAQWAFPPLFELAQVLEQVGLAPALVAKVRQVDRS